MSNPDKFFTATEVGTMFESLQNNISIIAERVDTLSTDVTIIKDDVRELKADMVTVKDILRIHVPVTKTRLARLENKVFKKVFDH
jgi:hypothetical protein